MSELIALPEIIVQPQNMPPPQAPGVNPFDKYDAPSRPTSQANPFDKYDTPTDSYTSIARSGLAGLNEGIASVAGAPVDAVTWALNKGSAGVNRLAGSDVLPEIKQPFGGSDSIKRGMSAVGIPTDDVKSNTPAERIAREAGSGAGSLVTGAGMVSAARAGGVLAGRVAGPALDAVFGTPDIGTAALGAASGAGAGIGAEVAPDEYKPLARMAGGLAGGAVPLAGNVVYQGGKFAVQAARNAAEPFTRPGQERLAGRVIEGAASNPAAVRDDLGRGSQEIVPGSMPTTFQQTGDMGLGQLERRTRTQSPDRFLMRDASQNAARQDAIQGVQPDGSPAAVADYFRSARDALDNHLETATAAARQRADETIAGLGHGGTAEAHGAVFRGLAQTARDQAKESERSLWQAVDPSGNMVMPANGIAQSARSIESDLSGSAKPLAGEERAIFDVAKGYGESTPFREVLDLRSRISAEMSAEKRSAGFTPVYRRLVQLRGAVEDSIDRAVENQATIEQRAVARGELDADDSMVARLERQRAEWYEQQATTTRVGTGGSEGLGGNASGGPRGFPPTFGTKGASGIGPGNAARAPGIQEPGSGTPLDADAASRLQQASEATRNRASTYDRGSVGDVLRPAGLAGDYRLPTSAVPSKVFHPGPTGGEDARAFIHAAGQREAIPALNEYAAFSLRRAAARPDGTMDPAKVRTWINQHEPALRELPEDMRARFSNVALAEDNVAAAVAQRRSMLSDLDNTAAAKVMGLSNAGDVTREIGSMLRGKTAAGDLAQLMTMARGSQAAREGIRRAVVEHIQEKFIGNTEAATSGRPALKSDALQTFVRTKADALAKIFKPEELGVLQAVARDLQRANRSVASTKLPGGSNTAQDVYGIGKGSGSILGRIVTEAVAAGIGHGVGGVTGGLGGWLGVKAAATLRDAGLARIDNLVTEAMLNPELARALLAKVPPLPDAGSAAILAARAKQLAIVSAAMGTELK